MNIDLTLQREELEGCLHLGMEREALGLAVRPGRLLAWCGPEEQSSTPTSATGAEGGLGGLILQGFSLGRGQRSPLHRRAQFALEGLMRGGGCGERVSFSRASSSATSRSGSVRRTSSSSRPSVGEERVLVSEQTVQAAIERVILGEPFIGPRADRPARWCQTSGGAAAIRCRGRAGGRA